MKTKKVSNKKRFRNTRKKGDVPTFKVPTHKISGTPSALAKRNEILSKLKPLKFKQKPIKSSLTAKQALLEEGKKAARRKEQEKRDLASQKASRSLLKNISDSELKKKAKYEELNARMSLPSARSKTRGFYFGKRPINMPYVMSSGPFRSRSSSKSSKH